MIQINIDIKMKKNRKAKVLKVNLTSIDEETEIKY